MDEFSMTIDGSPAPTRKTFDVVNPASGEVMAHAPSCSEDQLEVAMASSARAFSPWAADDEERRRAMHRAADAIAERSEELAVLLTAEQGKPLVHAQREAQNLAVSLRYFADLEVRSEVLQDNGQAYAELIRRPIGPVVAITPWNFPLMMAISKLAPALRAGNSVVLKPSPFTPLATLRLGEILRGALPAGVCNVISGPDPLGALMCDHIVPRKISFTGSIATGKRVAEAAGRDLKRVTLELGGNDPAILLDDVDPAVVVEQLFLRSFFNTGQTCIAIKRIYAPEAICADLVDALAARAAEATLGDGMDATTELGPMNNLPQLNRVSELVADAVTQGATVAAGGQALDRPGFFYPPTILCGLSDGVRLVDEEQFGPALPIIAYRDLNDAIRRANETHFGLGDPSGRPMSTGRGISPGSSNAEPVG